MVDDGISREFEQKRTRIRGYMQRQGLDVLLLGRQANVTWYLCGGEAHVSIASEKAAATLLLTQEKDYLITNNIEAPRLREEELSGVEISLIEEPWYAVPSAVQERVSDKSAGSDIPFAGAADVSADIATLRYSLLPEEIDRYTQVGADTAAAMDEVALSIKPGMTECAIAGILAEALMERHVIPVTLLIAADERIERYRHPLPTDKVFNRVAMLAVCGRHGGLITSMTRMVHIGQIPSELRRKHDAVTRVDAAYIEATTPGVAIAKVFDCGRRVYEESGYADEWRWHHQGGATGYTGRDYKGMLSSTEIVQPYQAFAWNPSISGTKSEDTILAMPDGSCIISKTSAWPLLSHEINGKIYRRPDILVL
ncbi:MAG: M24 family metallopeptidase [bacterium]|jgi:Xaa-Pro dipeptidase|nr:M24 family metallopeptidase [bacterium]